MVGIPDKLKENTQLIVDVLFSFLVSSMVLIGFHFNSAIIIYGSLIVLAIIYIFIQRFSHCLSFVISLFFAVLVIWIVRMFHDGDSLLAISAFVICLISLEYQGILVLKQMDKNQPKSLPTTQMAFLLSFSVIFVFLEKDIVFHKFLVFILVLVVMIPYLIHEIIWERAKQKNEATQNPVKHRYYLRMLIHPILMILIFILKFDYVFIFTVSYCVFSSYNFSK